MKVNRWFAVASMLAALLAGANTVSAETDVQMLQKRLAQMEKEMRMLRAEIDRISQAEPTQEQKVQEIEQRIAAVEKTKPKVAGNRVFFRGGWTKLNDERSFGATTDMNDVAGALAGLGILPAGTSITNDNDDGWYFGAGFDFLLSRDTLGLLPGTWALAELSVEFRSLGGEETPLLGPVAECLVINNAITAEGLQASGIPGIQNCAGIQGEENLTMLTVSASPKLKFREGKKLRPWIIPAGFDVHVISPTSDTTSYLDVGVQFAAGVDYEIMPGITLGADFRYHWTADFTDPDYSASAIAAASAAGLTLDDDASNDVFTAGVTLGIGF